MVVSPFRVGVVGGGAAGYTAAILLSGAGVVVDLYEARPSSDTGSGIMLQANALRVLRDAGVLDAVQHAGYGFDSTGVRLPDATGRLVGELTEGRFDADLPAAVGIARVELARILHNRAGDVGVTVRRGAEVTAVHTAADEETVEMTVDAGGASAIATCDLLIAADGVNSAVRAMVGVDAAVRQLPLGVWRVVVPRPAAVVRTEIVNGGPAYFAGYAPMSTDSAYAWLVEDYTDRRNLTSEACLDVVRDLAAGYHGPWDDIRASLTPDTPTSYTRYSALLVPPPWHRGRVVFIGDAVHACPPTMAQGAAQALEDAAVLAAMLITADTVDDTLLTGYARRRLPRVRAVVDASVQMAEWQLKHERGDVPALMVRTNRLLAQPA